MVPNLPDSVSINPAETGSPAPSHPQRRRRLREPRPDPVQLPLFPEQVALTRIRPDRNERRYYQIEILSDLFGAVVLARRWGRIGRSCRMRLEPYPDFGSALDALATLARIKRRRGYQDQAMVSG